VRVLCVCVVCVCVVCMCVCVKTYIVRVNVYAYVCVRRCVRACARQRLRSQRVPSEGLLPGSDGSIKIMRRCFRNQDDTTQLSPLYISFIGIRTLCDSVTRGIIGPKLASLPKISRKSVPIWGRQ